MSMETDRIENDLRNSRHRLSDTLGALGNKLSPGQMLDEALGLAQGQAGQFTANLGRQVRDNPLPAVLIAAGAALLFMKKNQRPSMESGDRRYHMVEDARSATIRMADETDAVYEGRLHAAYAKALDVKQSAGEAMDDFKHRVAELVGQAKHMAAGAGEKASHAMSGAAHMAVDQGRQLSEGIASARHKAGDFYHDTPLAAGAIAMAIGALIGGGAPLSNVERDNLGNVADKAARVTSDLANKGARMMKDAAATPVH